MAEPSAPGAVADEPADAPLTAEQPRVPEGDAAAEESAVQESAAPESVDDRIALLVDEEDGDDGDLHLVDDQPDERPVPERPSRTGLRRDATGALVVTLSPRLLHAARLLRTTGPLALVAATLVACTTSSAPPPSPTARVERASVTTAVSSSGSLSALTEQNLGFNKAGQLKTVNVKVGQRVAAGDVLATLDDTFFRYTLQQQEGSLAAQRAALTKLINDTSVTNDRKTADQAKEILDATKDQRDANVDSADTTVDRAQKQLSFDEDARDNAQDALDAANAACADFQKAQAAAAAAAATPTMSAPTPTVSTPTPTMPPMSTGSTSTATAPSTGGTGGTSSAASGSGGSGGSDPSEAEKQRKLQQQLEAVLRGEGPGSSSSGSSGSGTAAGGTSTVTTTTSPCDQAASAQSGLQQAERTVVTDKTALDQAKQQRDLNQANGRLSEANAQQSVIGAQNSLDAARTDRPSLIAQQRGLVAQQEALVRAAQKDVDDTVLHAPADATVSAVNGVVGEYLQAGSVTTPLAPGSDGAIPGVASGSSASTAAVPRPGGTQFIVLDNIDQFQVVVPFEETDAVKISPDQKVNVSFDAIPDLTLPGTVVSVSPSSSSLSSVISYYATVTLTQSDPRLRNGQTAQAAVLTNEVDDVLTVPNSAVHRQGDRTTVTVQGFDGPRVVEFQPGAVGDDRTQVLSGLSAGDEVVVPTAR